MLARFKTSEFGQRMYVVTKNDASIIFDPGYLSVEVLADLASRVTRPIGIFLTHGHFDHLNGIPQIEKIFGEIPVFMSKHDEILLKQNRLLQFVTKSKTIPFQLHNYIDLEEAKSLAVLDKFNIRKIHTPGHTPGSTSFIYDRILISGDTLLGNEIGPTLLPGGDAKSMKETMRNLKANTEFDTIAPGHGDYFSKLNIDWGVDDF